MSLLNNLNPVALAQASVIIKAASAISASHTTLDSATAGKDADNGKQPVQDKEAQTTLDSATDAFADQYTSTFAVAVVNQWVGTDDLEPGESLADRLVNTLIGIADENADGELGPDEVAVALEAFSTASAYMQNMGASAEDAEAIFGDDLEEAGAAASRVRELLAASLPDGDDAEGALLDSVVFTDEDQEPVMDSAYKKKVAIRGGRKVIIRKRISGTPKLSSKQKLALRKARSKAFGAGAMMRRAKSMRMRRQMGLSR